MAKKTIEEIRIMFEEKNFELISDVYINNRQKLNYICNNGHITTSSLGNFIRGFGCKICSDKKNGKNLRHNYEYIKSFFEENNCKLISKNYTGKDFLLDYVCNCGNISKISFNNFKRGQRCKKCSKERRRVSLYKNGKAPSSIQQIKIQEIVGGELNYPLGKFSLDIAFPDKKNSYRI